MNTTPQHAPMALLVVSHAEAADEARRAGHNALVQAHHGHWEASMSWASAAAIYSRMSTGHYD